jgi:hypothetical protein
MTSENAAGTTRKPAEASLDSKYGEIGISAVAAALRYKSETKTPAKPPVAAQDAQQQKWPADLAA